VLRIRRFLIVSGLVGLTLSGLLSPARAQPVKLPPTIPIEQIKPGMTGYGLTVFSGFKVERFKVRVISVLKNFLPKQDLFLVYVDHPRVRKTGVQGGMSGSPIYIQGKLAGALAYGWRFSKEPVAGITPIADMFKLLGRKARGPGKSGYASRIEGRSSKAVDRLARLTGLRRDRWWKLPFSQPRPRPRTMLTPVAVPLNVAGFGTETLPMLRESFASYGFEPVQGGGTGKAEGPAKYEPGGAVGVQLVAGDMAMVGTGTVTWTGVRRILGFGHRMFNAGEIYIPAVTARINHTLASVARSFKLSSPARVIGALVQDRQAGILVDTKQKIGTVPMTVTMRTTEGGKTVKRVFRAQLARHRMLTPTLAATVLSSAIAEAIPDVTHATMKVTARLTVKGYPQVKLVDHLYADSGARMAVVLFSRGVRAVRSVLNNPFTPAQVQRVDFDVQVNYGRDVVAITGLRVSSSEVDPGDRINLVVTFRPYSGHEFTKTYPLKIPRSISGALLKVEVASGGVVRPDRATPQNLRQYLKDIELGYSARSLVVSVYTPTQGVKLRGRVIKDLPASVIDALNTGTHIRKGKLFSTAVRQVHGTRRVITGKNQIRIRVRNEVTP
jgi:hypothetical protein